MKKTEELASRILNIYQFYQVNAFFCFLCKDAPLKEALEWAINQSERVMTLRWIPLNKWAILAMIQQEHGEQKTLWPIWQLAILMSLTEMVSMFDEYARKYPVFKSLMESIVTGLAPLWKSPNLKNFDSMIRFIRLCFVHGKDFTIQPADYKDWLRFQTKQNIQEIKFSAISKEYNLSVNISVSKIIPWVDIHEFFSAHQTQELVEFFWTLAYHMINESKTLENY